MNEGHTGRRRRASNAACARAAERRPLGSAAEVAVSALERVVDRQGFGQHVQAPRPAAAINLLMRDTESPNSFANSVIVMPHWQ